jgi:8-oxo-dGTP diphosphatase
MYTPPSVHSNVVLLQYAAGVLYVTLTTPTVSSGKAVWQLPTAPVTSSQTSLLALETSLRSTIGLQDSDITYREQLYTTEGLANNKASLCVSYLYLSRTTKWHKGTQQVGIFPLKKLPALSESDATILRYAIDRLHAKTLYSTVIRFLLPTIFDLNELEDAFVTNPRQTVDRRNFRKKFLALDVLKSAPKNKQPPQSITAQYSFKRTSLEFLQKPFPIKR